MHLTISLKKESPLLVMLYENLSDSAPFMEIPRYYGRANENGLFAINNIHPDTFRIIAMNDANNNLIYDPGAGNHRFFRFLAGNQCRKRETQTFIKDTVKIITPAENRKRKQKGYRYSIADTIIAPGKLLNALECFTVFILWKRTIMYLLLAGTRCSGKIILYF